MPLSPPSRLVILAPNWLGDCVMALPAIAAVRAQYASATLAVAARAMLAPLFELAEGVDEVVRLEPVRRFRSWLTARRDAQALAAARFDLAILFPNSFRAAWVAGRAGIAQRWGYAADGRTAMLTRSAPRVRGGHQAEYYQRLVEALLDARRRGTGVSKVGGSSDAPALRLSDSLRERARALLAASGWAPGEPLVGMAPGAAYGTAKQWPPERFGALAAELGADLLRTVLVGAGADVRACREVARHAVAGLKSCAATAVSEDRGPSGPRVGPASGPIDLSGKTTLAELAAVLAECGSFVTNDSGAMHLAAAVGVPVTAIFGSTNERETSPLPVTARPAPPHAIVATSLWCRPCMLRECPLDHACMTAIDVARVKAAVRRQWGRE
jgi:heptosyltransferase-2